MYLRLSLSNTDVLTLSVAVIMLFFILASFLVAVVILFKNRKQQHVLEITEMETRYAQELLQSQLEIQEQTLRHVSQEIHDNIGQVLSLAKLQLHALKNKCEEADLQPTKDLIAHAINDLRDLSKSLNPDRITEIKLTECFQHELSLLEKTKIMKTNLEVQGEPKNIEPEKKILVFRIFQELLNNVIKHSKANRLSVQIAYQTNGFRLNINDDGIGYDGSSPKGIGLTSINNRAKMIDATFEVNSTLGKGTISTLWLPL